MKAPEIHPIKMPNCPAWSGRIVAPNGLPIYTYGHDASRLIVFSLVVKSGSGYQQAPLLARYARELMWQGSENATGEQIAKALELLGARYESQGSVDFNSYSICCLKEDFDEVMKIAADFMLHPRYAEDKLQTAVQTFRQMYEVDRKKTDVRVRELMRTLFYGKDCQDSYVATPDDADRLTVQQLQEHHFRTFRPEGAMICLGGTPEQKHIDKVIETFGTDAVWQTGKPEVEGQLKPTFTGKTGVYSCTVDGAKQASILIYTPAVSSLDEQYPYSNLVYTLLGGYMQSRLMQNIREKKGLTYGISSGLVTGAQWGRGTIVSSVNADKVDVVIDEIKNEIRQLQNELASEEEIESLRNFLRGQMIAKFESPISQFDFLTNALRNYATREHLMHNLRVYDSFTAQDILEAARRHLDVEKLLICYAK